MPHSNESNTPVSKTVRRSIKGKLAILLTIVMFFLPVIAVKVYIVKYPLRWISNPWGLWTRDFISMEHKEKYRVVILGDSHPEQAFIPELLGDDVLCLSVGGNSPSDMFYVFKEYTLHNTPPDTVYITFYNGHFIKSDYFPNSVAINYFKLHDELEYVINAKKIEPESLNINEYLGYRMLCLKTYLPYVNKARFLGAGVIEENKLSYKMQTLHNGKREYLRIDVWNPTAQEREQVNDRTRNSRSHFIVSPLQDMYYRQLLNLCATKGCFIRILVIPELCENYGKITGRNLKSIMTRSLRTMIDGH